MEYLVLQCEIIIGCTIIYQCNSYVSCLWYKNSCKILHIFEKNKIKIVEIFVKIVIFLVKNDTNGEIHVSDELEQVEFKLEKK